MARYVVKQNRRRTCHRCRQPIHVGEIAERKRVNGGSKHYHARCYDRMHY